MNPPFSVIFLTTLIGCGQGLFIAIVVARKFLPSEEFQFELSAYVVSLALLGLGLFASFFHLGRPERAWRAGTQWKTSWLSREVIILPIAMLTVFLCGLLHWQQQWAVGPLLNWLGWFGVGIMLLLYGCTAMIYACIRFLQEWATPLTVVNFLILGLGSGFLVAAALAEYFGISDSDWYRKVSLLLLLLGLISRLASFYRNGQLKPKSTLQSAIGIKHRQITQRSMGHTGGSFNTRAFFHHCSIAFIHNVRIIVIGMVFVLPMVFLLIANYSYTTELLWVAACLQYLGLVAERWLFFAQANHPQNLYYQTVS